MIQELISILNTKQPSSVQLFLEIAAVIGVLGFLLWLMGARYSRQIVHALRRGDRHARWQTSA